MTNAVPRLSGEHAPVETTRLRTDESFFLLRSFGAYDAEGRMSRVVVTIDETDDERPRTRTNDETPPAMD